MKVISEWWEGYSAVRNRDYFLNCLVMFIFGMAVVTVICRF